jgi:hypothetical protein
MSASLAMYLSRPWGQPWGCFFSESTITIILIINAITIIIIIIMMVIITITINVITEHALPCHKFAIQQQCAIPWKSGGRGAGGLCRCGQRAGEDR